MRCLAGFMPETRKALPGADDEQDRKVLLWLPQSASLSVVSEMP
jgi:hypothetical protein